MDLPPDPPSLPQQPPHPSPDVDPSLPPHRLPYNQMITDAISSLNERNGSTKRSISSYIEAHYPNLPPTHPSLLTDHLKHLKDDGQILLVKQSYKLPGNASSGFKRRPGRPPKSKPHVLQTPVPVFAPSVDINAKLDDVPTPAEHVNGSAPAPVPAPVSARGRGRPPKRGPARPPKVASGRPRGRPKKSVSLSLAVLKGLGRPRGRPPKTINLSQGAPFGGGVVVSPVSLGGGGVAPVLGKRRGRPPKAGGVPKKPRNLIPLQPKKARKLSGKPLGRPRKSGTQESQLLVAYLDLKLKLENLQTRIKQTAAVIKPSLNNEVAMNALQELELAALNVMVPSNAPQSQQHHPQP